MIKLFLFIVFILICIWGGVSWYSLIKDFVESRKAKKRKVNSDKEFSND